MACVHGAFLENCMCLILIICHVHSAVTKSKGRAPEYGGKSSCSGHDLQILIYCNGFIEQSAWLSYAPPPLPPPTFDLHLCKIDYWLILKLVSCSFSHQQMAPVHICSHLAWHMRDLRMQVQQENTWHHRLPLRQRALHTGLLFR